MIRANRYLRGGGVLAAVLATAVGLVPGVANADPGTTLRPAAHAGTAPHSAAQQDTVWRTQGFGKVRPGSLNTIGCATVRLCFAGGGAVLPHGADMVSWNGTKWTGKNVVPPPKSYWDGIDCSTPSNCEAVASVRGYRGLARFRWDGKSWTKTYLHTDSPLNVNGVACAGKKFCISVGEYGYHKGRAAYLFGKTTTPVPVGVPFHESVLHSVSCASPTFCLAAGAFRARKHSHAVPILARWNGKTMTRIANPPGRIRSLSCATRSLCMAIGTKTGTQAAWTWRSGTWRTSELPAMPHQVLTLRDVDCPRRTACTAVGTRDPDGHVRPRTAVVTWNGKRWTTAHAPSIGGTAVRNGLLSVSCATAARCSAVGFGGYPRRAFAVGTTSASGAAGWHRADLTAAVTANPQPYKWVLQNAHAPIERGGVLLGVACATQPSCVTGGTVDAPHRHHYRFAQRVLRHWNGTRWSKSPAPAGGGKPASIIDAACGSPKLCFAISKHVQLRWNGKSWSRPPALVVPDDSRSVRIAGGSCGGAHVCVLVGLRSKRPMGSHSDSYFPPKPVIETYHSGRGQWSAITPSYPGRTAQLEDVSCPRPAFCVAVGGYNQGIESGKPWSSVWNGRSWKQVAVNTSGVRSLESVACSVPKFCMAITSGPGGNQVLVLRHGKWSLVKGPATVGNQRLTDVDCTGPTYCLVVGSRDVAATGAHKTLVARWNGKAFITMRTPNPGGKAASDILDAVSCVRARHCVAVGGGYGVKFDSDPLILRLER